METITAIEEHANHIVQRLAITKEEQQEMQSEFLSHMLEAKSDYEEAGYSKKKAEKLAISHFGEPEKVATDMHEAIFPHRKILFLILAVLSLIMAFSSYILVLFAEGDAHYGALITAVLTSTAFLILSEGKRPRWEKKPYLVLLLMLHGILFLYQSFLPGSITNVPVLPSILSILGYTIILFVIVLMYRVVLANTGRQYALQWLHIINMTIGLIFTAYSLFMLWGFLAFGGDDLMSSPRALMMIGAPLIFWVAAYISELLLMHRQKKKAAFLIFVLFCLICSFFMIRFVMGMMAI